MPINDEELTYHLHASTVKGGKLFETAELKAIRENILLVRMSTWLQIPKEKLWLDTLLPTYVRVLKGLWIPGANLTEVQVRSDWLLSQIDIRGWAHLLGDSIIDNSINTIRGVQILMVITPPLDAPMDVKEEYWKWAEERVLAPIKEQFPDLYSWIVDWHRRQIAGIADMDFAERSPN